MRVVWIGSGHISEKNIHGRFSIFLVVKNLKESKYANIISYQNRFKRVSLTALLQTGTTTPKNFFFKPENLKLIFR